MSKKSRKDEGVWRDGPIRERNLHMLKNGIGTDCTFAVGPEDGETKQFKAHRFLLCNASVVFETMLTSEMVEAKTGHARVTDLSPNTFHLLLKFIYADEVKMSTFDEACDVAYAANKYMMKKLFYVCLSNMYLFLNAENVWRALKFTKLLSHELLREQCIKVLQEDTMKCIAANDFVQADEDAVALLLEQHVLNVEDELELVDAAVMWASHEAQRRGDRGSIASVRAVLQPRLLPLLRLISLDPAVLVQTFQFSKLFTDEEKWAIMVCVHTRNCSALPKCLSANMVPRTKWASVFYCQRKVLDVLETVKKTMHWLSSSLTFEVRSRLHELKLLGFQVRSVVLDAGTCYEENIHFKFYNCGSSLSSPARKEPYVEFDFNERVTYNSIISVFLPKPIVLREEICYSISARFYNCGAYPNARRESKVLCQDFPNKIEFEFYPNTKLSGSFPTNDGLFVALICSL